MPYDAQRHHRRTIRMKEYNYAGAGAYFITLCTYQRAPLFGAVVDGEMQLDVHGEIVQACWHEIPRHFPHVQVDAFVVMPNHIHGIIVIVVGTTRAPPQPSPPRGPAPRSLGAVVGSFKSAVTRRINVLRDTPGAPVWQRNYYERIIRTERALNAIRRYIASNPWHWHADRYNPDAMR